MTLPAVLNQVGLIAIGRNEGERLKRCLASVKNQLAHIVYVDSGSTDGSVELVQSLGVEVVSLDLSVPFTAARARNTGFRRLLEINPSIQFVQFVDGDCEVVEGWLAVAHQALMEHESWAVVCGRRREKFPHQSVYNLLCDLEWDTPIGEAGSCGGDFLIRVDAFKQINGFNPGLIAGEEPEMCVRLRQQGWRIWRLDHEMTLHDAQMTNFGQWWKRAKRTGHAFAEGSSLHGSSEQRHWVRETRSLWFWGVVVPTAALASASLTHGLGLVLLLAYPLMVVRISARHCSKMQLKPALLYALSCVIGKFAQASGAIQFLWNRLSGKRSSLIEYKA
ncbi:MAG: glycosyltransferase [Cyanobacteria bacterium P01_F01_bin.150]